MTLLEAARQALFMTERILRNEGLETGEVEELNAALRTAISEAEKQEPVAWLYRDAYGKLKVCQLAEHDDNDFPVYTHPAPAVPEKS